MAKEIRRIARFAIVVLVLSDAGSSSAEEGHWLGVGLLLGEPSGLSAKFFTTQETGFQIHVAYSIPNESYYVTVDYLFDVLPILDDGYEFLLAWYLGLGISVGEQVFHQGELPRTFVGARAPIGLRMLFEGVSLELYAEAGPGVIVTPTIEFDLSGGIGVRYCF